MTETTQSIALEISAMIRANALGQDVVGEDILNAVARILESEAHTPADALALATFARRLLGSLAIDVSSDQAPAHQIGLALLAKAEDALEAATGKSKSAFEGEYSEGASHH